MIWIYPFLVVNMVLSVVLGEDFEEDKNHNCYRKCSWPAEPLTCNYKFELECLTAMSEACYDCPYNKEDCLRKGCIPLSGVQKSIFAVNGRMPGPAIHVCEGDTINVTVTNKLGFGEGTSIHWHGIHQRSSPQMDGATFITQYPIEHGTTCTYTFQADPTGTHYWHSHHRLQRVDGLYGSLVVRQSKERDVHGDEYDTDLLEHTIIVSDWFHANVDQQYEDDMREPDAILINGKGKSELSSERFTDASSSNVKSRTTTERAVFDVSEGKRHRFRVVSNAANDCPMRIAIDYHKLRVIASDGRPSRADDFDSITISSGERFDFVLNASQRVDNYWMRVEGLADCRHHQELAVVRYRGAKGIDPIESYDTKNDIKGTEVNSLKQMNSQFDIIRLRSLEPLPLEDTLEPNRTFYLNLGFHTMDTTTTKPMTQINSVSFREPSMPLLRNHSSINASQFCYYKDVTQEMIDKCSSEYCSCIHVIKTNINEIIEFVLINEEGGMTSNHAMHLHGYSFRVVAMGNLDDFIDKNVLRKTNEAGQLRKNTRTGPLKDTTDVAVGRYSIVQIKTDNPGWWFFHCHFAFHLQDGMSLVLQVGNEEHLSDIPDR
ncbi:uncharacterized protein [Apostichopus japonicus]|uniref:uncharacterized protein isoform X2 n=1 Tax=Stichopus japonicus TaxID=307972 RepID=UPI003AB855E0